jgi:hypothetical protein
MAACARSPLPSGRIRKDGSRTDPIESGEGLMTTRTGVQA